jgi:glycosyltransferase involved in cell wall biosynthesis
VKVGVVISTYRRPDALELVLLGYARQTRAPDEVLIADDGSDDATGETIDRVAAETDLPIVHVWHSDRGFGKTEALDRAIRAARSDYLIFTDHDCIPRADFVEVHERLAAPGRFLSGGYVKLSEATTETLGAEDVTSGRAFDPDWLEASGTSLGRYRLRLLPDGARAAALDRLTPTRPTWNGMSSSTWRAELERVNGFDLDFRYGGLDRELGLRLENAGLKGRQVRHRAVVLHLHHDRPYRDEAQVRAQLERRRAVRRSGKVRTERGIAELDDRVETRLRRIGGEVGA